MKSLCILLLAFTALASCKKYLDAKQNNNLTVPRTVKDLQALLDNNNMLLSYPTAAEIATDNFYLLYTTWQGRTLTDQNTYIWQRDVFNDAERNDWSNTYVIVYYANIALDMLNGSLSAVEDTEKENVKGQALFLRSNAFFSLLQIFAKPYDAATAASDLGIPLRLSSDLNIPTTRASVKESYDRLIADTKLAIPLLPVTPLVKTRPSRTACYALLARTYLSMADYANANKYADSALSLYNTLIDYNCTCINPAASNPFPRFNDEVIFHSLLYSSGTLSTSNARVDSVLYNTYDTNDIRKTAFFRNNNDGSFGFKGSYNGSSSNFGGLATDELYLVRAESNIRLNKIAEGRADFNTLMSKRWKSGTFVQLTTNDAQQALQIIVTERRKELLYRGLRWTDLRRLNKDPHFAVTLKRNLNGQSYTLVPNDSRYVFPIPENVIRLTGIQQN